MSTRKLFLVMVAIFLVLVISGCDNGILTNEIKAGWVDDAKEWEDSTDPDKAHLSYVDQGSSVHLDIAWNDTPLDPSAEIFGKIISFTYSEGFLDGKYTSDDNADGDEEFNIFITFSYSAPFLKAVVDADGVLGNKTLTLTAAP